MKVIKVQGGFGNQLFQFFLGYVISQNGDKVYFDISHYNQPKNFQFRLAKLFPDIKIVRFRFISNRFIRRFLILFFSRYYFLQQKGFKHYNLVFMKTNFLYLDGYWQNLDYFKDFKSDLISAFPFEELENEITLKYKLEVEPSSIIVHVRRGDYVNNLIHFTCTEEYYRNAICSIDLITTCPKIYFISDDIEYCKSTFSDIKNSVFITDTNSELEDFIIINYFKNIVISNSTFSWCAAWLNKEVKQVVAPRKWINTEKEINLYPIEWKII